MSLMSKFFGNTKKPEGFKGAHFLGYTLALISVLCIAGAFLFGAVDGIKNGFTFLSPFVCYDVNEIGKTCLLRRTNVLMLTTA